MTDRDRIARAFNELRADGFYADFVDACCGTCAWSAFPRSAGRVAFVLDAGPDPTGELRTGSFDAQGNLTRRQIISWNDDVDPTGDCVARAFIAAGLLTAGRPHLDVGGRHLFTLIEVLPQSLDADAAVAEAERILQGVA